jgi:hypothetical protein
MKGSVVKKTKTAAQIADELEKYAQKLIAVANTLRGPAA